MPEPVPVPATPDGNEDEGSDASSLQLLEPADLSQRQAEAAGGGGEHAAEMVSEAPRPDETPADETPAEVPWEAMPREPEGAAKDAITPEPGASFAWGESGWRADRIESWPRLGPMARSSTGDSGAANPPARSSSANSRPSIGLTPVI